MKAGKPNGANLNQNQQEVSEKDGKTLLDFDAYLRAQFERNVAPAVTPIVDIETSDTTG
jgi:hypothetical protein